MTEERRWEIRTSLGRRPGSGVEGSGWLWEIGRGEKVARVMIEITASAWATDPLRLPDDTRRALETDGRAELLKVLGDDDPPRVIRCGSIGCRYLYGRAEEWIPRDCVSHAGRAPAADVASLAPPDVARG